LKRLLQRRESLAQDATGAKAILDATRACLVKGTADAAEVTSAQSTFTALDEALRAVDAQVSDHRAQLAEARAMEQEASNAARIAELRAERAEMQSEFDRTRAEANEALFVSALRLREIESRYSAASSELRLLQPSAPGQHDRGLIHNSLQFGESISLAVRVLHNSETKERLKAASRAQSERSKGHDQAAPVAA
jgi:chromosome segregation ATPase